MYIDRHESGEPFGLFTVRQRENQEEIQSDHSDVIGFISGNLMWGINAWRAKTTQELDSEKQEKASNLLDYKIAIVALADVTYAVLKDPTKLPTTRDAWLQAIKDRYKDLI